MSSFPSKLLSVFSSSSAVDKGLWTMFGVFLIAKIVFASITIVAADEAYYWVWGENRALSYYDHPPLNAWIIGLTSFFFDNNVFAMRVPTFLTFAGTLYVYWLFSKRLYPEYPTRAFLIISIAFMASPTLFAWTSIVYNDHLLIFLSLAAVYLFADYFSEHIEGEASSPKKLYIAAALLGVAALAKYNAAFVGFSVALLVIFHSRLRLMLANPHIYAAGILCILMLLPVFVWNIQNDFASFKLHLVERYGDPEQPSFKPAPFIRYLLSTWIYFGPILIVPLFAIFFRVRNLNAFGQNLLYLSRTIIFLTLSLFTYLSTKGAVHWYWSALAYTFMLPFLPMLMKRMWLFAIHIILGLVFVVYATVNYSYAPIEVLLGGRSAEVERVYGWPQAGEIMESLEVDLGPINLATTGYPTAGQLAHTLDRTDIFDLAPKASHFSFVGRKNLPAGARAIVLHDKFGDLSGTAARFESLKLIKDYTFKVGDHDINQFEFYLGEGFIAPEDQ